MIQYHNIGVWFLGVCWALLLKIGTAVVFGYTVKLLKSYDKKKPVSFVLIAIAGFFACLVCVLLGP